MSEVLNEVIKVLHHKKEIGEKQQVYSRLQGFKSISVVQGAV
jgi:hypothetical protein